MPKYRAASSGFLNKYNLDFYKDKDTITHIMIPSDPDIVVVDPNPRWDLVLLSAHDTVAASATNTYNIPFTDNYFEIAVRVISGEVEIRFHDNTTIPFILYESNRFERFRFDKHLVNDILITGVQASDYIINVYELRPRDQYLWR